MMYFCIGDVDTVTGFRLVGVEGRVVLAPEDAKAAFREAVTSPKTGIVIVTETTAEMIREYIDKFISASGFPLILEIPGREGPLPQRKDMSDILRQAAGIKI